MVSENVFIAAKSSFSVLGSFFMAIADEFGEQKAVEMYGRQGRAFGGILGELFSQHMLTSDAEEKIAAELRDVYEQFGFILESSTRRGKIHIDSYRCPIYEGLRSAGLGHDMIRRMCMAFVSQEASRLKELHPDADRFLTEFRKSADGCCREEFLLPILQ